MRRWIAVLWHASFFALAGALYFFFVLPRWFELTGAWPSGLGLGMRIACGALIGLAALPVVFTLLRTRRPEFGTPQLALTLRVWSIVLHLLAGALIIGATISEIWVSLDAAGPALFGIYGGAAALAILGALAFYLAFTAELPPPPPKPLKLKSQTRGRRRDAAAENVAEARDDESPKAQTEEAETDGSDTETAAEVSEPVTPEPVDEDVDAVDTVDSSDEADQDADQEDDTPAPVSPDEPKTDAMVGNGSGNADRAKDDVLSGTLRNRRPSSKSSSRLFGRSRRGTALDD